MNRSDIATLVGQLNARYTGSEHNKVIGKPEGGRPRFELYHFNLSLCSYKVRTTLDEKQAAYVAHDVVIFPPETQNYYPEYVRLRLKGGESLADNFVHGYTGRSSTETEGFDPCVVPTLVDHEAGRVLVNSKQICRYLDSAIDGGTQLIPDDLEDEVIRQVDIVDQTPHVAVLYGVHPGKDARPAAVRRNMAGVHDAKIAQLRKNMALVGDDPLMVTAYEHKIVKETAAKAFVHTEKDMAAAVQEFKDIIARLEKDLQRSGKEWLLGDRFTLADVFWAVSLFRIHWLGLGYIVRSGDTEHYPGVDAYYERLMKRPSFERAVITWPLHPPSEYLPQFYPDAAS
jgi:2,5-dichlorohydroquinone reductive dechlorinase